MPIPSQNRRTIRSFVRRTGRLTPSQEKALRELWPAFGIDFCARPLDFSAIFARPAPVVLEIGFGNGESLVQEATGNPQNDYLGIEVHEPGVGHCLLGVRDAGIDNLRLVAHDAIEVLEQQIPQRSLSRINLYFPDPWPKKRHHKRRIVQAGFLELIADRLQTGATLNVATDWQNYAEHIEATLASCERFELDEWREHDGERPLDRPQTKFERRGLRKGHRIFDGRFIKRA